MNEHRILGWMSIFMIVTVTFMIVAEYYYTGKLGTIARLLGKF